MGPIATILLTEGVRAAANLAKVAISKKVKDDDYAVAASKGVDALAETADSWISSR
jgi:hypothetical protein